MAFAQVDLCRRVLGETLLPLFVIHDKGIIHRDMKVPPVGDSGLSETLRPDLFSLASAQEHHAGGRGQVRALPHHRLRVGGGEGQEPLHGRQHRDLRTARGPEP